MKHSFILFIASLFFSTQALLAQDSPKQVELGFNVSPVFASIQPDNKGYTSEGMRLKLNFGLSMDFRLFNTDNYKLYTGLMMLSTGGKLKYADVVNVDGVNYPATTEAKYNLQYINVPLAIRLKTSEIGYMKYYALFGGEVGYAYNASAEYEKTYSEGTITTDGENINDDIYRTRAAMLIGLGAERKISGTTRIQAGLHYSSAFTNLIDGKTYLTDDLGNTILDTNGNPIDDQDIKSKQNYLMLNIAVLF